MSECSQVLVQDSAAERKRACRADFTGVCPGQVRWPGCGSSELGLNRVGCCLGILVASAQGTLRFHFVPALDYSAELAMCV